MQSEWDISIETLEEPVKVCWTRRTKVLY